MSLADTICDILLEKYHNFGPEIKNSKFEFEAKIFTSFSRKTEGKKRDDETFLVSKAHWDNLYQTCVDSGMRAEKQSILTVVFETQPFRMRLTAIDDGNSLMLDIENKYRLNNYDDSISWVRYSFSQEKTITHLPHKNINAKVLKKILLPELILEEGELDERSLSFATHFQSEVSSAVSELHASPIKRLARRTSFYSDNFSYARIDMSEIFDEKGQVRYDVEVEMLNPKENMKNIKGFYLLCKKLVCSFRGSDNFYNRIVYGGVCQLINAHCYVSLRDKIEKNFIYKQIFNQVRTIKKDDLTEGAIVGGKVHYAVTYKTDGYRAILALTPYGVWLFMIPLTYNLISRTHLFGIEDITIIDGELIPVEKRHESTHKYQYYFQSFDALFVRGQDVRGPPLTERCQLLKDYLSTIDVDSIFGHKLKITQKPYREIENVDDFFVQTSAMIALSKTLEFDTDGLIFTPLEPEYTIGIDVEKDSNVRTLITNNEIVKWKNPEDTTIDLRLRTYEGRRRLLGVEWVKKDDESEPKEIPFVGDAEYPLDQDTMIDWEQIEEMDVKEGTIGEYGFNFEIKKFQFRRERDTDKQNPNTIDTVAIPNWRELQYPIYESAITGKSFYLMFYYHIRVKGRELIASHSGGSYRTLLDIGTGRGALIWYWNGYDRIIACEPNAKHRAEFKKRCAGRDLPVFDSYEEVTNDVKRYVILLPYMAQDTEEILDVVKKMTNNKGVDVVSLMDVGTFLWETPGILQQSVDTIRGAMKKGGRFLWKMMNGDLVRGALDTEKDGRQKYKLGKFYIDYEVEEGKVQGKIGVFIPGSITTEGGGSEVQEEWLTSVDEFTELLTAGGECSVISRAIANKERMMSENERTLSSYFEYGVIEKYSPERLETEEKVHRPTATRGRGGGRGRGMSTTAPRRGRGGQSTGFSRVREEPAKEPEVKKPKVKRTNIDISGL